MAEENTRARLPIFSVVVCKGRRLGPVALEREVVMGRDPRCELPLGAADVSRRHARMVPEPTVIGWWTWVPRTVPT
jgi:hypothetical protein